MSEYKENTVGWWLSQLKEPLMSLAMECHGLDGEASTMIEALTHRMSWAAITPGFDDGFGSFEFWKGVLGLYKQDSWSLELETAEYMKGFRMAQGLHPDNWLKPKDGGEDKAIVDSPKKTRELFFYGGGINNPFNEPLTISPSGEMLSVIVEEDKIKDLMNANPSVTFWPTNVGGVSPAPKDSWQESQNMGIHSAIRNHPKLGGKQPERAVVGYEEPKPIDTIEKKHEIRIQNLEARVKYLEDMVGSLSRSLDIITKRVFENG